MSLFSSPKDKDIFEKAIREMSDSMTRVDAEKDLQKEIIEEVHEKTGIEKKYVRKVAGIYHKRNFPEFQTEVQDVDSLYEECF